MAAASVLVLSQHWQGGGYLACSCNGCSLCFSIESTPARWGVMLLAVVTACCKCF
jgi:hypothetical protein